MTALADDDSTALLMLDSMFKDMGYDGTIQKLNELMAQFRQLTESLPADPQDAGSYSVTSSTAYRVAHIGPQGLPTIQISDIRLALKMQKYVVLKEFVDTFIHQTVSDYQYFGTILGFVPGLQAHSTAVLEIQSTLAFVEFIMSKVVLSAMPAKLQSIQLDIPKTDLEHGELTQSTAVIRAINQPSAMTINDWVGLVVTKVTDTVGTAPGFETNLLNVTNSFITWFNDQMTLLTADPDVNFVYDMDLTSVMPQLTWQAAVTTPQLYKMGPLSGGQLAIIHPQTATLEWQADDVEDGEADAYLITASDANSRLIGNYLGGQYLGGAFGLDALQSNVVKLAVNFEFGMQVDATRCIETGDQDDLDILVGKKLPGGGIDGLADMDVAITATNGSVYDNFGKSDASGHFQAQIAPAADVSSMTLTISASDPTHSNRQLQRNIVVYIRDTCSGGVGPVHIEKTRVGDTQPLLLTDLTYDGAGHLTQEVSTYQTPDGFGYTDVSIMTYDSQGHIATRLYQQLGKDFSVLYQYQTDQNGNITSSQSERRRTSDNRLLASSVASYSYDLHDNETHSSVTNTLYFYDDYNKLDHTQDTTSQVTRVYTYDADGRMVEQVILVAGFSPETYYYEYNADGYLIHKTWYDGNVLLDETTYTNDSQGNVLVELSQTWDIRYFY